jgi:chromo domain-containing protein 1
VTARPLSSSSSDIPLADVAEQRRQAQHRIKSADTAISKKLASSAKGSPRPQAAVVSSADAPPSPREHSAGLDASEVSRGRGATRGGSSLGPKNVFASRGSVKKRPTLIENSTDPSKDPKHYSTMRIRWMAQKAGRGLADAAPDLSALGGLFDPSNPSTFQSLKPGILRKVSNPLPNLQDVDLEISSMDVE